MQQFSSFLCYFFCKYFNTSSFNWNKSYRIIKTFEKQAVESSVWSFLNNVGPTLLGPFEQGFKFFRVRNEGSGKIFHCQNSQSTLYVRSNPPWPKSWHFLKLSRTLMKIRTMFTLKSGKTSRGNRNLNFSLTEIFHHQFIMTNVQGFQK